MTFSRQEYWSGLLWPPPRDLPNPGIEPMSLRSPALASKFFTTGTTWEAPSLARNTINTSCPTDLVIEQRQCLVAQLSRVWILETLWSVVHQVPLSMGFPGENTGRGLPFLSLGDLPKPGIKAVSPSPLSQADSLPNEPSGKPRYIDRDMLNSAIPSPWIHMRALW